MITIALSTVIGAPRERVWEALTEPAEIARWDERLLSWNGGEGRPLGAGGLLRGRYRLGAVPVALTVSVLGAEEATRLEVDVCMGLFRFRETSLLADESRTQTRLSMRVAAENALPVVGGVIDRFDVRKMASERVDERLRQLRAWCETPPTPSAGTFA